MIRRVVIVAGVYTPARAWATRGERLCRTMFVITMRPCSRSTSPPAPPWRRSSPAFCRRRTRAHRFRDRRNTFAPGDARRFGRRGEERDHHRLAGRGDRSDDGDDGAPPRGEARAGRGAERWHCHPAREEVRRDAVRARVRAFLPQDEVMRGAVLAPAFAFVAFAAVAALAGCRANAD